MREVNLRSSKSKQIDTNWIYIYIYNWIYVVSYGLLWYVQIAQISRFASTRPAQMVQAHLLCEDVVAGRKSDVRNAKICQNVSCSRHFKTSTCVSSTLRLTNSRTVRHAHSNKTWCTTRISLAENFGDTHVNAITDWLSRHNLTHSHASTRSLAHWLTRSLPLTEPTSAHPTSAQLTSILDQTRPCSDSLRQTTPPLEPTPLSLTYATLPVTFPIICQ